MQTRGEHFTDWNDLFARAGIKKPKKPTTPSTKGVRTDFPLDLERSRRLVRSRVSLSSPSNLSLTAAFRLAQMDPKFLRNQKYAKKGSLKAAGKK